MQLQLPAGANALITEYQRYRVDIKLDWAGAWEAFDYLEVQQVTNAVAPSMPSARCRWVAGQVKQTDSNSFPNVKVADFAGYFIRIVLMAVDEGQGEQTVFVGRFGSDDRELGGSDVGSHADQDLTIYGIAHELDRNPIRTSVTNKGVIDSEIAFNERYERGYSEVGNRSAEKAQDEEENETAFVFAGYGEFPFDAPQTWTAAQVIEHLLAFHGPTGIPVTLAGQVEALDVLDVQKLDIYGQTLWSALNEIIDRRRGLGFYIFVDDNANTAELRVFTIAGEDVAVGNQKIPANKNIISINLANDLPRVKSTTFAEDFTTRYGKIVVLGERIVSCGTFSYLDGSLIAGWEDNLATEYKTAVGTDQKANDQYRGDDKFDPVYTTHRVPSDFDWRSKGGDNKDAVNLNPKVTATGELNLAEQGIIRDWGLRASRELPIRRERSAADPEPDYRKLLAFVYDDATSRFVNADAAKGIGTIRPLENDLGIEINTSERKNHLMAKGHWEGAGGSETEPKYDYEKIVATFSVRLDQRIKIEVDVPGGDASRELSIFVPGAELHYVASNTKTGVTKDGGLETYAGDPYPRDDRDLLKQIAAQAKAWYGRKRTAATLTGEAIWNHIQLASYVLRCERPTGYTYVNGVVSSISYDFGSPQRTTIKTSFGELDLVSAAKSKHKLK